MTATEGRTAIVAGSGALPEALVNELTSAGSSPVILAIAGEADNVLLERADATLPIEQIARLPAILKAYGVNRVVFAGGVVRRPRWHRLRLTFPSLTMLPRAIKALGSGDDALLRTVNAYVEKYGIEVVGAHQLMPRLLTPDGVLTNTEPHSDDWPAIRAGYEAARAIGLLDIGQAAIAFGRRAVALEGIEGTDGLLERTRAMREHGRLASTRRGVLVKCCKPSQDMRADLPTIGPKTVEAAYKAGLSGIALEAGRSLILELENVIDTADRLGLYVLGVREDML